MTSFTPHEPVCSETATRESAPDNANIFKVY
uniref:Uncharacterized protein n=1 Tax=Anguilla anguilla TaxID=7936 RepID=A0A0E9PFB3_ANGAN